MAEERQVNPCFECSGTGEVGGEFCIDCLGTGYRGGSEINLFLKALYDHITTKCDALDTKIDALQADMDIIKPQIQALYDDLNP